MLLDIALHLKCCQKAVQLFGHHTSGCFTSALHVR